MGLEEERGSKRAMDTEQLLSPPNSALSCESTHSVLALFEEQTMYMKTVSAKLQKLCKLK